jgi:pimeloyl-ACP methyl ester carboxylesterase
MWANNAELWKTDLRPRDAARAKSASAGLLVSRLRRLHMPTLLILGPWPRRIDQVRTSWLVRGMPHAEVVELPEAAPWLNLEEPDRFNDLVVRFLDRLPGRT